MTWILFASCTSVSLRRAKKKFETWSIQCGATVQARTISNFLRQSTRPTAKTQRDMKLSLRLWLTENYDQLLLLTRDPTRDETTVGAKFREEALNAPHAQKNDGHRYSKSQFIPARETYVVENTDIDDYWQLYAKDLFRAHVRNLNV